MAQVMAVFLIACKEMPTRMKKFLIWMLLCHLLSSAASGNGTILTEI